ncbi:MAG: metallophosphoesterase [Candidatus Sumerlaeaceae bacterium]|nr:metallophosphoesterase [Candidatus Sumerlaeaceae bacterium]
MKPVRFLQFSDVHLDSSLTHTKLKLTPMKREQWRRDIMRAVRRLPEVVKDKAVDVVLCPGDLWEEESVRAETATELFEILEGLGVPVVIAPGNHDYFHPLSYYDRDHFETRLGKKFPANVHVFTSKSMETLALPELGGEVVFHGSCFTENHAVGRHPAFGSRSAETGKLNIALVHGSLIDIPVFGLDTKRHEETAHFSRRDILDSGYDYVALGHYHAYSLVEDSKGYIRAAYSGVLVARGLDETRDHFVIVGEVGHGGVSPSKWERFCLDKRHIHDIEVELDAEVRSEGEIVHRIRRKLHEEGVTKDDIVYVRLKGQIHPQFERWSVDEREFDSLCWHIVVDWSSVEAGYDLESLKLGATSKKEVLGEFLNKIDQAEAEALAANDLERVEIIREARQIGLDALHGKEVRLRYEID